MSSSDPRVDRAFDGVSSAYARGRLYSSLRVASFIVPMIAVALGEGRSPRITIALGAALLVLATFFRYRGGAAGRAVWPALIAGLVPLFFPLIGCPMGNVSIAGLSLSACTAMCFSGGLVAGVIVAALAPRLEARDASSFAFAGLSVTCLTGSIGCSTFGAGGVAGMALGLAMIAAPSILVVRRVRA